MRTRYRLSLLVLGTGVLLFLSRSWWLPVPARLLLLAEEPRRADLALVLAGDMDGNRILTAAQLARDGVVPKVLVSGPLCCYGARESDLAVAYAVSRGYAESLFDKLPLEARSTRAEAAVLAAELHRRRVRRFLLVTSTYHTRRAARMFRPHLGNIEMTVVAAPEPGFPVDAWWHDREAQKILLLEWLKTAASFLGG